MGNLVFDFLNLPEREAKPRKTGLTLLRDYGMGFHAAQDLVSDYGEYIDYMKMLHFTVLYHESHKSLEKKVRLYRDHDINVFPGGIVFETAIVKDKTEETLKKLKDIGFNTLEVSDNIVSYTIDEKLRLVESAVKHGFKVIAEVGSKYPDKPLTADDILDDVNKLKDAGINLFIVERGEIALYFEETEKGGRDTIGEMIDKIGLEYLTFEAESLEEQAWFIKRYGGGVNLGPNIHPNEIAFLEGLRRSFGKEIGYGWLLEQQKTKG